MAARADRLGDADEDAPGRWEQGMGTGEAHVLVMVNAPAPAALEQELRRVLEAAEGGLAVVHEQRAGGAWRATSTPAGAGRTAGRNATFMVYRKLHQEVAAFRRMLRRHAGGAPGGEELLAAKIVGRWRDGTPLVLSPDAAAASATGAPRRSMTSAMRTTSTVGAAPSARTCGARTRGTPSDGTGPAHAATA